MNPGSVPPVPRGFPSVTSTFASIRETNREFPKQQSDIGDYILDSLFTDIDTLSLFADIHPKPDGRLHRALAKRFTFAIYDDMHDDTATVIAVLDCRQNPASFKNRLNLG